MPRASGLAATMQPEQKVTPRCANSRGRDPGDMTSMSAKKHTFTGKGSNNRKLTDEDRAEIIRLYTTPLPDGTWMGVTTIARRYGVATNAIYSWMKRAGVQTRSAKESHAHGKRCKPVVNLPVGDPPTCRCECGEPTAWNRRKNRWNAYVDGHRHKDAPYKNRDWLLSAYVTENRTCDEIGEECGVGGSTIARWLRHHSIPARDRSAARIGRQSGDRNPAWKGGVAEWDYAPEWKRIARTIRHRDEWTCQMCAATKDQLEWGRLLHVHHIDGDKMNNDGTNLIAVCAKCHPRGPKEVEFAPALRSIAANREGVMPECQS